VNRWYLVVRVKWEHTIELIPIQSTHRRSSQRTTDITSL